MKRACGAAAAIALCLGGCDLAPRYRPPHYVVPDSYQGDGPFAVAHPRDLEPRTDWWQRFGDLQLDGLESQLAAHNPDLAAATERYAQARDLVAQARAGLYPQITAGASLGYVGESQNTPFLNRANVTSLTAGDNRFGLSASWEPDIWSAIRNQVRTQSRLAQAGAATLAAVKLSLQAELANDYAALRGADEQVAIYRAAISTYNEAVEITTLRLHGKISSGIDVERARSQLEATRQLLEGALANRALLQHAIATLAGSDPSAFAVAPEETIKLISADVPAGVPSALLERRPDVAAAERRMAAANAAIGVARAAFYPNITLSGTAGFQDTGLNLFNSANSLWSIGPAVTLPLFEGGLRRAELQQRWSQYAQTRDEYRSTVLSAFREVEGGLAQTTHLSAQVKAQAQAAAAADRALDLAMQLYVGGLTSYLDVVVAQETALSAHITEAQVRTAQIQAEIALIRALGGGWSASELPTPAGVIPFGPLEYGGSRHDPGVQR